MATRIGGNVFYVAKGSERETVVEQLCYHWNIYTKNFARYSWKYWQIKKGFPVMLKVPASTWVYWHNQPLPFVFILDLQITLMY